VGVLERPGIGIVNALTQDGGFVGHERGNDVDDLRQTAHADPLGPLLLRVVVADGHLKAEPLQLAGPPGQTLSGAASVDAAQAQWDLHAEGKGLDLGAMLTRFGRPGVVTGGPTELVLQLRGRGKTLPALLASLDGDARVQVGPMRIHNVGIDFDRGVFARALGAVNPARKTEPDTDVKCFVARVPIKSGVLSSDQSIAAETPKYNVVLNGSLDLRTEAIDIALTPVVKSGLAIGTASIAQIVRVVGTLANPALAVDPDRLPDGRPRGADVVNIRSLERMRAPARRRLASSRSATASPCALRTTPTKRDRSK